jgi:hypothetical protein
MNRLLLLVVFAAFASLGQVTIPAHINCPDVQGTTVSSDDMKDGAMLSFRTRTGSVIELRALTQRLADEHNQRMRLVTDAGVPRSVATVEKLDDGARMVFRVEDPSQLDELRARVQQRALLMNRTECDVMMNSDAGR